MSTASDILHQALELSVPERADLARQLLLSLEAEDFGEQADVDAAWTSEIRRRLEAIRTGQVQLNDWNDALARLRKSLSDAGP